MLHHLHQGMKERDACLCAQTDLTFPASNHSICFLSTGKEQSFPSPSASSVSWDLYFLHNIVYSPAENPWKFVLRKFNFPHSQSLRKGAMLCSHPYQTWLLAEQRTLSLHFFFPPEPNTGGESIEQRMRTGISHANYDQIFKKGNCNRNKEQHEITARFETKAGE